MVGLLDVIHRSPSWKPQPKCGRTRFPAFAGGAKGSEIRLTFNWWCPPQVYCFVFSSLCGWYSENAWFCHDDVLFWAENAKKAQPKSFQLGIVPDCDEWWWVITGAWCLVPGHLSKWSTITDFSTLYFTNLIAERRGNFTKETIPLQETPETSLGGMSMSFMT